MLRIALLGTTFILSGCLWTSHHGDAKVKRTHVPPMGGNNRTLTLPEFSISEPGVHRYRVSGLPVGMDPEFLQILATESDLQGSIANIDPPWVGVVLQIRITDSSGLALYDQSFEVTSPRSWYHTSETDYATYSLPPLPTKEARQDYEVVVEVVTPSSRVGDVAHLRGYRSSD